VLLWSRKQRIRAPSANGACSDIHLFDDADMNTASVLVGCGTLEREDQTIQVGMLWNMWRRSRHSFVAVVVGLGPLAGST
jgi:hypothetical protein